MKKIILGLLTLATILSVGIIAFSKSKSSEEE